MEGEKGQNLYQSLSIKTESIPTNIFRPDSIRTPDFSYKLCSIEPNLNNVIEQSEDGSQRERGHKKGHETILDNCRAKKRLLKKDFNLTLNLNNRFRFQALITTQRLLLKTPSDPLTHFHVLRTQALVRLQLVIQIPAMPWPIRILVLLLLPSFFLFSIFTIYFLQLSEKGPRIVILYYWQHHCI